MRSDTLRNTKVTKQYEIRVFIETVNLITEHGIYGITKPIHRIQTGDKQNLHVSVRGKQRVTTLTTEWLPGGISTINTN